MQRRDGEQNPTKPTSTPDRGAIVDALRTQSEYVSVRDVLLAGGARGLTVKELFG